MLLGFKSYLINHLISTIQSGQCFVFLFCQGISVNSSGDPLLGLVHCAGEVPISSPCPVWKWSFSPVLFLKLWCLFLLLPLVILEILFCGRKQFSASVLPQDKYWSLTTMQQPSPWDALLEKRLTMQDRSRRNRFNQTAWQNQAQYYFRISMTNSVIGVQWNPKNGAKRKCELLNSCQVQMQAPRPGKRVVQDNALKLQDRLWLECCRQPLPSRLPLPIAAAVCVTLPSAIAVAAAVAVAVGHCRPRHHQPSQLPSPLSITVLTAVGHCQELLPWRGKNCIQTT